MTRPARLLLIAVIPALGLVALGGFAARTPSPILINESPSLPRGLYILRPDAAPERGAIVALRQPAEVRPYLARLGMPSEVRLIKRVAAGPGDRVCADGEHLIAPHRIVRTRRHDRTGAALPVWRGCRSLGPDERLLLGDTPASFDSRYFGPVSSARIEGVYRELLTW